MRVGVRDHDALNGLGVTGSRLMATYGLDGKPFRVEVRWPDFVLKTSAELRGRDRVLKDSAEFVGRLIDRGQSMSATGCPPQRSKGRNLSGVELN